MHAAAAVAPLSLPSRRRPPRRGARSMATARRAAAALAAALRRRAAAAAPGGGRAAAAWRDDGRATCASLCSASGRDWAPARSFALSAADSKPPPGRRRSPAGGSKDDSGRRRGETRGSAPAELPPLAPTPPLALADADLPPGFPASYSALAAAAAVARTAGRPAAAKGEDASSARRDAASTKARLTAWATAPDTRDRALALYVNTKLFDEAVAAFQRVVRRGADARAASALAALAPGPAGDGALFRLFAEHCFENYADEMAAYR